MSAGYLWRAALDGEVPQKVLAGVPSELRAELGQTPFSSLSLIRPPSAHDAAPVAGPPGHRHPWCFLADALGSGRGTRDAGRLRTADRSPFAPRIPLGEPLQGARGREGQGEEPTTEATAFAAGRSHRLLRRLRRRRTRHRHLLRLRRRPCSRRRLPPPPPPPPPFHKEIRPGKGKGDKNHVHTGSGWGRSKKHHATRAETANGTRGGRKARRSRKSRAPTHGQTPEPGEQPGERRRSRKRPRRR